MGKKMGLNEKAAEARAKKQEAKSSAAATKSKAADDAYWSQHENPRGKKDAKREEDEKRKAEAAAKKAELKRLAAEEEAAMANLGKKKAPPKKVTHHQLHLQSEADRRKQQQQAEQKIGEIRREIAEDQYAQQLEHENLNREEIAVAARSLDAAVKQLSLAEGTEDRHPEKRAKAAWEDYYARELPIMKEEKPGLKLMQYKNRIFEMWQRSPENPRNQIKETESKK